MARKAKLVIENHPRDYTGYPFMTLIEYNGEKYLTVVDNHNKKTISVYILDSCDLKGVPMEDFIMIAEQWYNTDRSCPLSIELARLNLTEVFRPITQQFTTGYVTRVIGPFPDYDMGKPKKVKKRKRKKLPKNVEYVNKF